jgi:hypothetical protein
MNSVDRQRQSFNRKGKSEGKYVRVGVQRLEGVAILYVSRYTCHGMHLTHFEGAKSISIYVNQR